MGERPGIAQRHQLVGGDAVMLGASLHVGGIARHDARAMPLDLHRAEAAHIAVDRGHFAIGGDVGQQLPRLLAQHEQAQARALIHGAAAIGMGDAGTELGIAAGDGDGNGPGQQGQDDGIERHDCGTGCSCA